MKTCSHLNRKFWPKVRNLSSRVENFFHNHTYHYYEHLLLLEGAFSGALCSSSDDNGWSSEEALADDSDSKCFFALFFFRLPLPLLSGSVLDWLLTGMPFKASFSFNLATE